MTTPRERGETNEDGALLEPVPFGFCHCRCGGRTPISKRTDRSRGYVKGQPVPFLPGHYIRVSVSLAKRYWAKVDKNGPAVRPELGPCWLWIGSRNSDRYGTIWDGSRMRMATHIALELAGFIIPFKGLQVLHKCDNPPCVRPDHLRIGTSKDDADDRVSKGRQARGERQGAAKLENGYTTADEIRRLYAAGDISKTALGRLFGIHRSTVGSIVSGEYWKEP